jgi:N-acetylmuramoyl-L-alanine amidase
MADFFENSSVDEQLKLMRSKGTRKFSKRERDSISVNIDSKKISKASLKDLRIAIDPGHFGTSLAEAQVEQKFLYFVKDPHKAPGDTVKIFESQLTFNTASLLQKMLQEQGATVFLTRTQGNYTSFNCTFADWMKFHQKRTLDSLRNIGSISPEKYLRLMKATQYKFFWDFFRDYDLANRARKVNAFNPHLTIIIHYNVDEKNSPWKAHTKKNFSMAFIGGAFTSGDLSGSENKMHFIRLMITTELDRSEKLAGITVSNFSRILNIPIARSVDATYLKNNCIPTSSRGVFCRNLVLCRKINSPLVYGESLYQDNENETELLMRSDLDLYGIKTNERLKKVAISYYEAVLDYVKSQ